MRLYIRLLYVVLSALWRKKDRPFSGESVLAFTVMPWDCVVQYMGNDRYHAFMDLGRIDLMIRLGAWDSVIRNRLQPFVLSVHIRHQQRLRRFQKFVLRTRLVHTDSRFFLMEHIFQNGTQIMATALSKNGLTCHDRIVATGPILKHTSWQLGSYEAQHVFTIDDIGALLLHLRRRIK